MPFMRKNQVAIFMVTMTYMMILFQGCINENSSDGSMNNKNMFYVDIDGSTNFTSIQQAIDIAPVNYTIFVYDGHYNENIIINKTIHLMGENPLTTIIDGKGLEDVIFISANNVIVENFTIINSGKQTNDAGVRIDYADNNTIKFNIIANCYCGIYSIHALNNVIRDNMIKSNSEYGMYAQTSSDYMRIIGNSFFFNSVSLRVKGSQFCEIIGNQFNDSEKGMYFCCGARNNDVHSNNFINNSIWNADDQVSGNTWYNNASAKGNYWDDYSGVDEDRDGIGDTPYNITSGGSLGRQDLFPLIDPL
jgi:parallel beta-helix repeat protein